MDEGKKYLDKGDFQRAETIYAKALAAEDSVPVRNNLATAIFLGNDPRRALDLLEPVLEEAEKEGAGAINTKVNPYTYALRFFPNQPGRLQPGLPRGRVGNGPGDQLKKPTNPSIYH